MELIYDTCFKDGQIKFLGEYKFEDYILENIVCIEIPFQTFDLKDDIEDIYDKFKDFHADNFYYKYRYMGEHIGCSLKKLYYIGSPKDIFNVSKDVLFRFKYLLDLLSKHYEYRKNNPIYVYEELEQYTEFDREELIQRYAEFRYEHFAPSERYIAESLMGINNKFLIHFKNTGELSVKHYNMFNKFLCELGY